MKSVIHIKVVATVRTQCRRQSLHSSTVMFFYPAFLPIRPGRALAEFHDIGEKLISNKVLTKTLLTLKIITIFAFNNEQKFRK